MTELIDDEIRHSTLVRAAPERVYDGLATAQGLDSWFTDGSAVDARPGGEIRFRWRDWGPQRVTAEDGGPVLEARRPERFVFQWHPDGPSYATTVEIDLEPTEGGTVIHLSTCPSITSHLVTRTGRRKATIAPSCFWTST